MQTIFKICFLALLIISCKDKKEKASAAELAKYEKTLADVKQSVSDAHETYSMDSSQLQWEGEMRALFFQSGYSKAKTEKEIVKASDSIWLRKDNSQKLKDWYLRFRRLYHPNVK